MSTGESDTPMPTPTVPAGPTEGITPTAPSPEPRPVVLSASSVHAYLECELQYWFTYVAMERGEQGLKAVTGIAGHEAVEHYLRGLPALSISEPEPGGIDEDELTNLAMHRLQEAFTTELRLGPVKVDREETPNEALKSGLDAFEVYLEASKTFAPAKYVEMPFEIEVNGIPYSGTLDRYDEDDTLRDTKFPKSRPQKGRYRLPMIGYAVGIEATTGDVPKMLVLDHIVRTKTPYYWPEYIDPPTVDDVGEFATTIERVAEGIDKGRWRATGLESRMACYMCAHTRSCGPYQRAHEED